MKQAPKLEELLPSGFSLQSLKKYPDPIYIINSDFTIIYINDAWLKFAEENGGGPDFPERFASGAHVLNAISEACLKEFYKDLFTQVLSSENSELHPFQQEYECSTPSLFRKFLMSLYRLKRGLGVLVVNVKTVEADMATTRRPIGASKEIEQLSAKDIIRQCSHCRLIQSAIDKERWVWIPAWVSKPPPNVSHTLCAICHDYFFPISD